MIPSSSSYFPLLASVSSKKIPAEREDGSMGKPTYRLVFDILSAPGYAIATDEGALSLLRRKSKRQIVPLEIPLLTKEEKLTIEKREEKPTLLSCLKNCHKVSIRVILGARERSVYVSVRSVESRLGVNLLLAESEGERTQMLYRAVKERFLKDLSGDFFEDRSSTSSKRVSFSMYAEESEALSDDEYSPPLIEASSKKYTASSSPSSDHWFQLQLPRLYSILFDELAAEGNLNKEYFDRISRSLMQSFSRSRLDLISCMSEEHIRVFFRLYRENAGNLFKEEFLKELFKNSTFSLTAEEYREIAYWHFSLGGYSLLSEDSLCLITKCYILIQLMRRSLLANLSSHEAVTFAQVTAKRVEECLGRVVERAEMDSRGSFFYEEGFSSRESKVDRVKNRLQPGLMHELIVGSIYCLKKGREFDPEVVYELSPYISVVNIRKTFLYFDIYFALQKKKLDKDQWAEQWKVVGDIICRDNDKFPLDAVKVVQILDNCLDRIRSESSKHFDRKVWVDIWIHLMRAYSTSSTSLLQKVAEGSYAFGRVRIGEFDEQVIQGELGVSAITRAVFFIESNKSYLSTQHIEKFAKAPFLIEYYPSGDVLVLVHRQEGLYYNYRDRRCYLKINEDKRTGVSQYRGKLQLFRGCKGIPQVLEGALDRDSWFIKFFVQDSFVNALSEQRYTKPELLTKAIEIAEILEQIHAKGIVHMSLKASSFRESLDPATSNTRLMLIDPGHAAHISNKDELIWALYNYSLEDIPPELKSYYRKSAYGDDPRGCIDLQIDVWQMGVIFSKMFFNKVLSTGEEYPAYSLESITQSMLADNPRNRPTMTECVSLLKVHRDQLEMGFSMEIVEGLE